MIAIVFCASNVRPVNGVTPDMTLDNQKEQNYTLTKDLSIVVGIRVPPAVVVGLQTVGYSQFAFMGWAYVPTDCSIVYQDLTKSKTYAVQKEFKVTANFAVELSKQQNLNAEMIFISVMSTCDLQVQLIAAAVHQFDAQVNSLTKAQPQGTFFVHKHVPGATKQIQFDIDTQYATDVWVGSAPKLLSVVCADCYVFHKLSRHLEFGIDVDRFNNSWDYIYYSISQPLISDVLISANIADVHKLDLNVKQQFKIENKNPLHFELSNDYLYQSLNVLKNENVTLCFTDKISFTGTDCSVSIKKSGTYDITPEMIFSLLVYTDTDNGAVELQVSPKQEKQSKSWILWVVLGVIALVIVVVAFSFFFMRYKKQKRNYEEMPLGMK
ncbi:Hypothetical_protein [Hexamita inflata]|uniref:Hypothetical_protein n=1 Tax=Hexamita inflata TaxID=28002 RepID=A0AA86Q790_9EUKA|nr:Hypothetical protein HINF_LOCUS40226 [Hexamita inflata]CAI9952582.1 Hypothetical protein HINF_LOCUS40227 [Hexamita inflata]CAI9952583.1 Hypothetical protein HINF_LOCUS40228 [Hexamita inflata]